MQMIERMERYFEYGEKEIGHLKRSDLKLADAIDKIGKINRAVDADFFSSLVRSIIGQQISTQAQKTIWTRMKDGVGDITPENMDKLTEEEIQKFGVSFRKASYIKSAAAKIRSGELDVSALQNLSDEDVIKELLKLKGVGVWTAEMLMIFSMCRPDIISYGDLAIRRGMCMLYGLDEIDKPTFEKRRKRYSPYGSVASFYIWAIAGGALDRP